MPFINILYNQNRLAVLKLSGGFDCCILSINYCKLILLDFTVVLCLYKYSKLKY